MPPGIARSRRAPRPAAATATVDRAAVSRRARCDRHVARCPLRVRGVPVALCARATVVLSGLVGTVWCQTFVAFRATPATFRDEAAFRVACATGRTLGPEHAGSRSATRRRSSHRAPAKTPVARSPPAARPGPASVRSAGVPERRDPEARPAPRSRGRTSAAALRRLRSYGPARPGCASSPRARVPVRGCACRWVGSRHRSRPCPHRLPSLGSARADGVLTRPSPRPWPYDYSACA